MAKVDLLDLRKTIGREEFDYPLLKSVLSPYKAIDQRINVLLKNGAIIRVKKGLYVFGSRLQISPICTESLANLIYGPSCISLEYALSFHGLIPERVVTITSVTPKRNKEFKTPIGRFTYRYLSMAKYPHEINLEWFDAEHPVLMATPEKALCDYVALNQVRGVSSRQEVQEFLLDDLRIARSDLARLDLQKLLKFNNYYDNPTIANILSFLG